MTAPNWNPGAPLIKGVEHLDIGYGHTVVDAPADVGELQWEVLRTGELDTIELYAGRGASAPQLLGAAGTRFNDLRRPMLVELVPTGSEAWGAITVDSYAVTALTNIASSMFNENLTQPITPSRLNASNDGQFVTTNVLGSSFEASFGTGAFPLDRQVLAVEVHMSINLTTGIRRIDPTGSPWSFDVPMWSPNFVVRAVRWGETIVDGTATSWKHWTPQMIRDYASGGTRRVRIACRAGPGYWKIDRLVFKVFSIPERRRGVGIGIPSTSEAWVPFTMTTPNATGSPVVTAGEPMTLMLRRITDYSLDNVAGSVLPWRYLRGVDSTEKWRRHSQPHNPLSGMPAAGPQLEGIPTARMLDGGTVIDDSMPYWLSRGSGVYGNEITSQRLTFPGDATVYGQAYVVAGWNPNTGRPVAPLRCEVFRVSDGVRVLGATEVTAPDVARLPTAASYSAVDDQGVQYKLVKLRFDDATTLAAGQYEVRLSSPGSTSSRPWFIAALVANKHTTNQTYGGATDYASGQVVIDGQSYALTSDGITPARAYSSDIQAALVEVPPPITGVGTSVGSLTTHHAQVCDPNQGCEGCADDSMPYATVTWPAATDPDVVGYDIDRLDDLSPDWERVAAVGGRLSTVWYDQEVRIGVRSQYRIRVARGDGVTGDWSEPVSVLVPPGQIALTFSSNAATGMGCVYPEVWTGDEADRTWEFTEAGDVTYRRIYGRNRPVAFRPMERRGDAFPRTLLLNALCSVTRPSMATFHPLRDLSWAPIPYVCVRDGEGNRWFASLEVPDGRNRRADAAGTELWLADIQIVEVADSPAVHDTTVPQVETVPSP